MSEPLILGWQVLDPDGNVVESGEVTVVEVDVIKELVARITDIDDEGEPWPA